MRTRRLWLIHLGLVLGSIAFTLLSLEVIFRAFGIRGYYQPRTNVWEHAMVSEAERRRHGYPFFFKPYSTFELNYDSNPTGYFNEKNGLEYKMNRYGLRGPDFEPDKEPGIRRILVLGDSFVFGEGVRWEHTTTERLEVILNARGEQRYEVINAAVPAWDTVNEVHYLFDEGRRLEPDHIMVGYCLNDAAAVEVFRNVMRTFQNESLEWSYLISYIYGRFARRAYTRHFVERMVKAAEWNERRSHRLASSMKALSKGNKFARDNDMRFTVFIYPFMYSLKKDYPFLKLHRAIVEYCQGNGIEVLDLYPFYAGREAESLWAHPTDPHPNVEGHEIAAKALADYLLDIR